MRTLTVFLCRSICAAAASVSVPCYAQSADYSLGVQCYGSRDYRKAEQHFSKAIKTAPNGGNAHYYLGLCHQNLGELVEAKRQYQLTVERFPSSDAAVMAARALKSLSPGHQKMHSGLTQAAMLRAFARLAAAQEGGNTLPNDVKVPFSRHRGGHVLVDVHLNGRPLRMIFDTGAESILIGKNQLAEIGVAQPSGPPVGQAHGVGGAVAVWAMPAEIQLGTIKRRVMLTVQDTFNLPPLLGQPFFRDYAYDIDTSGGFIHFTKKTGSQSAYVPQDTINIPFTPEGRELVVEVSINGRPYPMYFDTGASGVVLSLSDALSLGINIPADAPAVASTGVGGSAYGRLIHIQRLELGPILKTNIEATVLMSPLPRPLLGQSFFGSRRFTIDNESRMIRFWR